MSARVAPPGPLVTASTEAPGTRPPDGRDGGQRRHAFPAGSACRPAEPSCIMGCSRPAPVSATRLTPAREPDAGSATSPRSLNVSGSASASALSSSPCRPSERAPRTSSAAASPGHERARRLELSPRQLRRIHVGEYDRVVGEQVVQPRREAAGQGPAPGRAPPGCRTCPRLRRCAPCERPNPRRCPQSPGPRPLEEAVLEARCALRRRARGGRATAAGRPRCGCCFPERARRAAAGISTV